MTVKSISPQEAARMVAEGAVLVDIREPDECVEIIEGSRSAPLSTGAAGVEAKAGQPVIFHCRSGRRTAMNAEALKACSSSDEVYLVEGGIDAWKATGLPVQPGR